jgi:ferredoxin
MPHVVTDNCRLCRYTECVEACPVDCFHADGERVYIDPEVCIDCGACIPVCPVNAISEAYDLGGDAEPWIEVNARGAATTPLLTVKSPALPTAAARRAQLGY